MIGLSEELIALVDAALAEDVGSGDVGTAWTVPTAQQGRAYIVAGGDGVIAGLDIADVVFRRLNARIGFDPQLGDGDVIEAGGRVGAVQGPLRGILAAQRTALNFLQRLSGIATLTRRYVEAVEGTGARILPTRRITPGWRWLEEAAVLAGGGEPHRLGVYETAVVGVNHVAAAGGLAEALERVRRHNDRRLPVEVEVRTIGELEHALVAGAGRILLEDMDISTIRQAVRRVEDYARWRGTSRPELVASGDVGIEGAGEAASAGVDLISVAALTHSAPALDLSLRVIEA